MARVGRIEKERHRGSQRPGGTPLSHLLPPSLFDAFLFPAEPQELQCRQRLWLALKWTSREQGNRGIQVFVVVGGRERVQKCVSRSRWL